MERNSQHHLNIIIGPSTDLISGRSVQKRLRELEHEEAAVAAVVLLRKARRTKFDQPRWIEQRATRLSIKSL